MIFPAFIYGALFNRAERIDTLKRSYKELSPVDANYIEKKYIKKYGKFELSQDERKIYYLEWIFNLEYWLGSTSLMVFKNYLILASI